MVTTREAPAYLKDPLYKDALRLLQSGQWSTGLDMINQLEARYPDNQVQLHALHTDMSIRSHIDEYEVDENRQQLNRNLLRYGMYILGILAVAAIAFYLIGTYAGFIQSQVEIAREQVEEQSDFYQLLATYRNAQSLFRAGRAIDAAAMFEQINSQIQSKDYPDEEKIFVNLPMELEQARSIAVIETKYNQANELRSQGKLEEALAMFRDIKTWDPRYRDVEIQINELEAYFTLEQRFTIAEGAFAAGEWVNAIKQFEAIRDEDSKFKPDQIEARLFECYLNAAQAILQEQQTSEQLKVAEDYFAKALELKPQDPATVELRKQARKAVEDALIATYLKAAQLALVDQADSLQALATANEWFYKAAQVRPNDPMVAANYEMARRYLAAIEEFNTGDWDLVIENLEYVYSEDSGFAAGTAAQTLYDAYLARGSDFIGTADYEAALEDFKRAAAIATASTDSLLQLIKAQAEMARTLGLLSRYDEAVTLYQEAVAQANLVERAKEADLDVFNLLTNAQVYSDNGNYKSAYTYYRNAMENLTELLASSTHVVQEGEYLTQLAREYGTTVEAIMEANNITSRRIEKNQQLIIPNLEEPKP